MMAKYGGSIALIHIKFISMPTFTYHSNNNSSTRNCVQIRSLKNAFHTINAPIVKTWTKNNHKLMTMQQFNAIKIFR